MCPGTVVFDYLLKQLSPTVPSVAQQVMIGDGASPPVDLAAIAK
jgi:hypothetical protein